MTLANDRTGAASKILSTLGVSSLVREDLVAALARRNGGDAFDVDGLSLHPDLVPLVPEELALRHRILPIHRTGNVLFVAVPGGAPGEGVDELERLLGIGIEPIAVDEIDVVGILVKAHQLLKRMARGGTPAAAPPARAETVEGPDLERIGLPEGILRRLRKVLAGPQGLLLVSGPARSGKTGTLRAIVQELKRQGRSVAAFDRSDGVASVEEALKRDPDALAVDETSSPAVASALLRAAAEGRLLVMTFQAADALAALARLGELQVDPHLASSALRAALTQRLASGVCPDCAESKPEDSAVLEDLRLEALLQSVPLRRGRGCATCKKTGARGRIALFEYGEKAADGGVRESFQPLIADALGKLVAGTITLKDVAEQVPFTQILQAADRLNVRKVSP